MANEHCKSHSQGCVKYRYQAHSRTPCRLQPRRVQFCRALPCKAGPTHSSGTYLMVPDRELGRLLVQLVFISYHSISFCKLQKHGHPCEQHRKASASQRSQRKHEGKRPHVCQVCQKTFRTQSQMEDHVSTVHPGTRPYACHLCPFAFAEKCNLKAHINEVHEKLRPHKCDMCTDRVFARNADVKRHKKNTHYFCVDCNTQFNDGNEAKTHRNCKNGASGGR